MKKKNKNKKILGFILTIFFIIVILPIESFMARAEEPGDETVALGYKVGDYIKFGKYEQDNNLSNGKEDIEWQILHIQDDGMLVLSRYGLDCRPFSPAIWYTWSNCPLRTWLNNDFYNSAFSASEKAKLKDVETLELNILHPDDTQTDCIDKVFLLTRQEMMETIGYVEQPNYDNHSGFGPKMMTISTPYAISKGAVDVELTSDDYYRYRLSRYEYTENDIGRHGTHYYLRTTGMDRDPVTGLGFDTNGPVWYVSSMGYVGVGCSNYKMDTDMAVRPAIFIKMSIRPTAISLNQKNVTLSYGQTVNLTASLTPADVLEKSVTWSSSDEKIATVSGGTVKAKSAGKTTITAKTVNGLTATCEVTVFADNVAGNIFADIKADSWMYNPAKSVYDKGYMTGTGTLDGRVLFSPNTDMNRTMFVQALYSMDGKPAVTYVQKFSDVKESAWYAKAVTWASNNGIVAGNPDGTFGVNGKATREQLALMLYKYADYMRYDISVKDTTSLDGFTDASKVDSWALTAVKWAVERGIISGKGNASDGYRIDPIGRASRVECAAMMNKFSESYANAPKMCVEDLEEPLALPEEEIEDVPVPADETEDETEDEATN